MTAIQAAVFYKVYYFTCNWRHCNLVKTIPVIFRRIIYGQMQQVPEHRYRLQTFPWVNVVHILLCWHKYDNSHDSKFRDFSMSCARFLPSAPSDSLCTLIHPILCPSRLILMDFIKELPAPCLPAVSVSGTPVGQWRMKSRHFSPGSFRRWSTHLTESLEWRSLSYYIAFCTQSAVSLDYLCGFPVPSPHLFKWPLYYTLLKLPNLTVPSVLCRDLDWSLSFT